MILFLALGIKLHLVGEHLKIPNKKREHPIAVSKCKGLGYKHHRMHEHLNSF